METRTVEIRGNLIRWMAVNCGAIRRGEAWSGFILFYLFLARGRNASHFPWPKNPFTIDRGNEAEPLSERLESSMATGSVGMQKVAISRNDASR